jgi:triosephosphate isomerase
MSSTERTPLIAGNWKMNGSQTDSAKLVAALVEGVGDTRSPEMLLCPPAAYLGAVRSWLEQGPIGLGAQDLSQHEDHGPYTGEISGRMLADNGCRYVIVGHSERRTYHRETDELVAAKFVAAQAAALVPVLCVGETLEERRADATETVVLRQVRAVVGSAGVGALGSAVIAYEPVWAIGTGEVATPDQAQAVHAVIRRMIAGEDATIASGLRILYGGSMKGSNAAELLAMEDIDGGLVGGASLDAVDFLKIFHAASA